MENKVVTFPEPPCFLSTHDLESFFRNTRAFVPIFSHYDGLFLSVHLHPKRNPPLIIAFCHKILTPINGLLR